VTAIERRLALGQGVALSLLAVYLIWGSTYLAIRFAIETLPPFTMAGARFLVAGAALYAWARWRGAPRPKLRHWAPSLLVGGLLLLGGNGGVVWGEGRIPSGVAALLVAVEPVWIAVLAPLVLRQPRGGLRALGGLAAGVAGVAVLVLDPRGLDPTSVDLVGAAVVVGGGACWALGSLVTLRVDLPESRAVANGLQMLSGGALLVALGGGLGEWRQLADFHPSLRSLGAFVYLVVFGSIVAFSAYSFLLRAARPIVVATYAFVNPVVAVFLGWLLGGEALSWRIGVASTLILAAVALLITEGGSGADERGPGRSRRRPRAAAADVASVAEPASIPVAAPEAVAALETGAGG
jgi:drug/metabolite transporter (DMT)-like permease